PESRAGSDDPGSVPTRIPRSRGARNAPIFGARRRFRANESRLQMVPKEMNAEPSPEVLRGRLIAIGGSAGAVRVLRELLSGLRLEVPIVIVLHVAPGRDDGL